MRKLLLTLALLALATAAAPAQETTITGFVDAAYFYDNAAKNGEFTVDQVEVDIVHRASEKTSLRADLEWLRLGDVHEARIEQAFMTYTAGPGWDLTFGKFNTPMGLEALDPVDMYQYSHSQVFDFGGPANLTGAAVAKALGRGFDVIAHMSNGWDADDMAGKNVTWGGRFGYGNAGFGGGVAALSGKEEEVRLGDDFITPFTRTIFDVDLSYETGRWLFGGEYNQGHVDSETATGDEEHKWVGFLVMTHISLADWSGFTFRYDCFDDQDGWYRDPVDGEYQKVRSFTFCPTFSLDENFGCLVELRINKSDRDGFENKDGEPTDTNTWVAFEATYSW